jgi:hypothetical protein
MFTLSLFSAGHITSFATTLFDGFLANVAESIAAFEARLHEAIYIEKSSRDGLHNLKHLQWFADGAYLWFTLFEDCEANPKNRFGTFVEKSVPNAQYGFDWKNIDEAGHKPWSHSQVHSGEAWADGCIAPARNARTSRVGRLYYIIDLAPNWWQALLNAYHENTDVNVGFENFRMYAGEMDVGDYFEEDESLLFIFVEHQEQKSCEEV